MAIFYWWFRGDWVLSAAYAGLGLLATLSVPLLYRLGGFTLADEVLWLESREAEDHKSMLARLDTLEKQLEELNIDEGVKQARTLSAILNDYHSVVETRFLGKKHSPVAMRGAPRA